MQLLILAMSLMSIIFSLDDGSASRLQPGSKLLVHRHAIMAPRSIISAMNGQPTLREFMQACIKEACIIAGRHVPAHLQQE